MIREFVQGALGKLGYEFRRKPEIGFNAAYLSQICQPKTVIDVGVGHGTYALYKAFPDAHFVLVEPLKDYESSIDRIVNQYDCEVHYKAVGNRQCELEMNVDTGDLKKSSLRDRTAITKTGSTLEKRTVEVTKLDTIYSQCSSMKTPMLLKIDTEGNELSALEGARSLLQVVEVVITETSIVKRFEDSYEFEDIIFFMSENGFQVFSFLTMIHAKGEARQRFADVVFKRRGV